MKKIICLSFLSCLFILSNVNAKTYPVLFDNYKANAYESVQAYIIVNGEFVQGYIQYQVDPRGGYIPFNYNFDGIANGNGRFLPDQKFTRLNPNNPLAVKYNFTHSITAGISQYKAYVILD